MEAALTLQEGDLNLNQWFHTFEGTAHSHQSARQAGTDKKPGRRSER